MSCTLAEGGTHWLWVSWHPQNIPPQPLYLSLPVLIKFCLGKDNENIFLHFLTILPDEIMQSRNVLREEKLAADTSNRRLTVLPHCYWGCQCVQELRTSQRALLQLSESVPLCAIHRHGGGGKGHTQSMTRPSLRDSRVLLRQNHVQSRSPEAQHLP